MRLAIVATEQLKDELLSGGISDGCTIYWLETSAGLSAHPDADAVIDLLFEQADYDATFLTGFLPRLVIVNSVNNTIGEIGFPFIRINAWPGFLERKVAEVSCGKDNNNNEAEKVLALLNRKAEWVPDEKGFVSARVVSMIVNEAYFTLEEQVSTKEEIDTAMKLGTNYPYGPFEWAKKIGLKNIANLLTELSVTEKRYRPAGLLLKEASAE